ncbi:MAG: cation:proton antiporter [Candidatus Altiarchaeota archaeon]
MAELTLFWDIGVLIVAASIFAHVARILRQPLILAYIFTGIVIGPFGYGLIAEEETIKTLSEFGIAFLLFIVGLELDLTKLKELGFAPFGAAVGKSIIMFCFGFLIAALWGYPPTVCIYLGIVVAFSSTMIVIKLLSDKRELDTLHGRMIIGILLVEDVLAILALSVLSSPGGYAEITASILKGLGLFSIAIVLSRFVVPPFFRIISKSHELLFLTALSICFIFAFISDVSGFSIAIGSFIAGLSIASFPYNIEIVNRVRSLRDFFAILFFSSLGMEIWVENLSSILLPLIMFLILVLVFKPLIIMALNSALGYGRRSTFLTAIGLAQISEFSLIIALQGLFLGHLTNEIFSLVALIAVVSFAATSYLIKYDNYLYGRLSHLLTVFDKFSRKEKLILEDIPIKSENHIIVAGCHNMGFNIIKTLKELGEEYLVVDYNPETVSQLIQEGVPCIYGDIGDVELLERIDLKDADIVISTVPSETDGKLLIQETKKRNPNSLMFVRAKTLDAALELYYFGADYVIIPDMLAGKKVSEFLHDHHRNPHLIDQVKEDHIIQLEKIKEHELLHKYEPSFLKDLERTMSHHARHHESAGDDEHRGT